VSRAVLRGQHSRVQELSSGSAVPLPAGRSTVALAGGSSRSSTQAVRASKAVRKQGSIGRRTAGSVATRLSTWLPPSIR